LGIKQSEIPEMLPIQQTQRPRFSPVVFDLAPAWLTLAQAAELCPYDQATLLWMIREGMVDAKEGEGGYLVSKAGIREYQECLALVLHWDD
jgi:hypothetical protein